MRHRPVLLALITLGNTACASVVLPESGSGVYGHLSLESSEPGPVLYQQVGRRMYLDFPPSSQRSLAQMPPAYAPICALPCEVDVDVGPALYVDGNGITRSDFFRLDPSRGPVTFVVEPGSSTRAALSAIGVLLGSGIFALGGFGVASGEVMERPQWVTPGLALMGVGLSGLFAGALLFPGSRTILKPKSPPPLPHP